MKKAFYTVFVLLAVLTSLPSYGQKKIVQFTGIVVGGDSLYGIPEVAVYVPRTGRGVLTNHVGYFSLPTLSGDTVTIKAMGFREKKFPIPDSTDKLSVIIRIELDTFMLPEITLWPYPTFESFREAFLAYELATPEVDYAAKNLEEQVLRRMMYNSEATASMNHRYFVYDQARKQQYRYSAPTLTLLNPFAWARFIKDVQGGGLKNKKWEDIDKRKHEKED